MKTHFENKSCKYHHPARKSKAGFAILLVLAGVTLLAFNLGWIPIEYKAIFLSWQMLLIALGINSLIKRQVVSGLLMFTIGAFFLFPVIGRSFPELGICSSISFHTYWPVLLILAGIFFLLSKGCCKKKKKWNNEQWGSYKADVSLRNDADAIEKNVMFNSSEQIVFSTDFKGGEVNVMFGEINLDLRKITHVDPNNMLEVNTLFGSTAIYVPSNWELNMKSSSVFASIQDKRMDKNSTQGNNNEATNEKVVLNLKCSSVFGNIEIRS